MAFRRKQDIGGGDQFKFEKIGQSLTGYYLGSFDHEGEYGPTKKHVFKTPKGIKVVFGQTHLTQLLADESAGPLMKITYSEDKKMKKGNPMKVYSLDIDDEQKLDADELPSAIEEAQDEADADADTDDQDEPTEVEDEEQPLDEVKTAPATNLAAKSPSQASRDKVAALLAKRKAA